MGLGLINGLTNEKDVVLNFFYPVGTIYISSSSTAPTFGGTWQEVLVKQTWNQMKNGYSDYAAGTNTGNLHYWRRTA